MAEVNKAEVNKENPMSELNGWEGLYAGPYRLDKYLGGTDSSAVYATVFGSNSSPAVIKLMPVEGMERSSRLTRLSALARLSHPNLVRFFEAGECRIDGVSALYVVMERADANLAEVLPERALTEAEAREMLDAVVPALSFLHDQGFVHGNIKPSNILAIGEQIKLSPDSVANLDAGTPAEDVRALGATLVQVLTRSGPEPLPKNIPQPFREIAANCLKHDPQTRWSVRQIAAQLQEPLRVERPVVTITRKPGSLTPVYVIAIAVLATLAVLLLSGRGREQAPAAAAPAPSPTAPAPAVASTPGAPSPVAAPQAVAPPAKSRAKVSTGNWFVVAATYAQQNDAENRSRSMARKWPQFKPAVYAPKLENQKPYYVVVLGSNLSQPDAVELKERARSTGIARDAYITRFQ
jgi:hypothetical protein